MSKIEFLLAELRRIGAIGRASDYTKGTIMFSSDDTVLLSYVSDQINYRVWFLVRRSSRQYYKVYALITDMFEERVEEFSCRNFALTAQKIKNLIRR